MTDLLLRQAQASRAIYRDEIEIQEPLRQAGSDAEEIRYVLAAGAVVVWRDANRCVCSDQPQDQKCDSLPSLALGFTIALCEWLQDPTETNDRRE